MSIIFPQTASILNAGLSCIHTDGERFTIHNKSKSDKKIKQDNSIYNLILLTSVYIAFTLIYYYAFKIVCENGFSLTHFLMAYFFTLPYIIIQTVMKTVTKKK
jgi:hypothetical protein